MSANPNQDRKPVPDVTPITGEFWRAAKEGKLVMQKCKQCGRLQWYPKPLCADCGSMQLDWTQVSGKGEVYSYTIPRQVVDNSPAFEKEIPFVVALVQLEEGPRLYTNIIGCPPEDVRIGMKVTAVFEKLSENIALPKFKPLLSK